MERARKRSSRQDGETEAVADLVALAEKKERNAADASAAAAGSAAKSGRTPPRKRRRSGGNKRTPTDEGGGGEGGRRADAVAPYVNKELERRRRMLTIPHIITRSSTATDGLCVVCTKPGRNQSSAGRTAFYCPVCRVFAHPVCFGHLHVADGDEPLKFREKPPPVYAIKRERARGAPSASPTQRASLAKKRQAKTPPKKKRQKK